MVVHMQRNSNLKLLPLRGLAWNPNQPQVSSYIPKLADVGTRNTWRGHFWGRTGCSPSSEKFTCETVECTPNEGSRNGNSTFRARDSSGNNDCSCRIPSSR